VDVPDEARGPAFGHLQAEEDHHANGHYADIAGLESGAAKVGLRANSEPATQDGSCVVRSFLWTTRAHHRPVDALRTWSPGRVSSAQHLIAVRTQAGAPEYERKKGGTTR